MVDAIASASAGSMTGLIASRALLFGANPIELMVRTWVELPQLDKLDTHDLSAPLTMKNLLATADALLGPDLVPDGPAVPKRSRPPLDGVDGPRRPHLRHAHRRDPQDPQAAETLLATTYVDFYTSVVLATTSFALLGLHLSMTSTHH